MSTDPADDAVDALTLRFVGEDKDGTPLHELRAAHVAEVLQGVVGIAGDFTRAGAFGDNLGAEVLVRPAREGSFIIEVVRTYLENPYVQATGAPTLSSVIWWATQSARAEVSDYEHLDNGNVKVIWQDNTVQEIPRAAWDELNKRDQRRKKHLRQILAPLSDERVSKVEVIDEAPPQIGAGDEAPPASFVLAKEDYEAVRPDDDVQEDQAIFEVEGQMSAIDFDNPKKWRVKTPKVTRSATVEDEHFLKLVETGLAIRKSDIFWLRVREDLVQKNGRTRRTWTVLQVKEHRRAAHDDDA